MTGETQAGLLSGEPRGIPESLGLGPTKSLFLRAHFDLGPQRRSSLGLQRPAGGADGCAFRLWWRLASPHLALAYGAGGGLGSQLTGSLWPSARRVRKFGFASSELDLFYLQGMASDGLVLHGSDCQPRLLSMVGWAL